MVTILLQDAGNIDFFSILPDNHPKFRGDETMKKFLLPLAAIAFASPAAAQSIVVVTAQSPDSRVLPVAYAELPAGTNDAAIAKPTASEDRKSVGKGKSVSVRVDIGGRRRLKK